ncbi:MAG: hypothetical protein U0359_21615 [Byssovorax sp.]
MGSLAAFLIARRSFRRRVEVVEAFKEMYVEHREAFRGRATNRVNMRRRDSIVLDVLARFGMIDGPIVEVAAQAG